MSRLSRNEIEREIMETTIEVLAAHQEAIKPSHADTSTQNDYTKSPTLWNAPTRSIAGRAAAHTKLAAENAAAKRAPATLTPEEQHQERLTRRRAAGNTQQFNRMSFRQVQ